MSATFTQLRRTIELAEKVKVDSGEKIVKTDKVGRKKNIEVTLTTKGGKFFVYFDGEKYAGQYRSEDDAMKVVKDYLKLVGEELTEVRGKVGSSDGDEEADKNIIMQLRKVVTMRGLKPVTFDDKKQAKINPKDAEMILRIYDKLMPASKLQLQTVLAKSKSQFDGAVRQLKTYKEEVELDENYRQLALKGIGAETRNSIKVGTGVDYYSPKDGSKHMGKITKVSKTDYELKDDKTGKTYKFKYWSKNAMNEEVELDEAGLPPHLAKLFDKDGNFKDPKKQKIFNRMMGDGIGKEIAQKMGRIKFRVDADSAKKTVKVYVDSNDEKDAQKALKMHPAYISGNMRVIPEEGEKVECPKCKGEGCDHCQGKGYHLTELDEAPKMKYALVGKDMKIYSMGSDERDLRLDRRSLEKRFKDAAPLKIARLKTAQAIGDKVDKSQIKEELEEKYTAKQYKMAFGVLNDPRWKGGNMTRIVNTIEKIAKGLSKDKAVARAIQLTNEAFIAEAETETAWEVDVMGVGTMLVKGKNRNDIKQMLIKKFKKVDDFEIGKVRLMGPQIKMWHRKRAGDKPQDDGQEVNERELTPAELKNREKIAKDLPDADFKKRYGDKWMQVKMGTATNMAKGES